MSGFHNVAFPLKLARGAMGGPQRTTQVFELGNGREARNTNFAGSRRRWDVGSAIRSLDELALIIAFFEARRGRLYSFRFRDPADFKSCLPSRTPSPLDQIIGVGDGVTTVFQLRKTYGDAAGSYQRPITKPVAASVRIAKGGSEIPATGFSLDALTGKITLAPAPAAGVEVRAGFVFDTPVRFEADRLDLALDAFDAGRVVSLGLVEVVL
ncbi:MAG: hypothetical protein RLZZ157_575 [Pseudomonadota bacterium]|jgi:uncharacterized protein (TIGR02217 family)